MYELLRLLFLFSTVCYKIQYDGKNVYELR